mgnify:FL=1
MQRLAGSILIIASAAGIGWLYGTELKNYLQKMRYIRYVAGLIKGELEYTGAPLAEVFRETGRRVKKPFFTWLVRMASEIDEREESAFARIWNRGIDRDLRELNLKSEHSILLKELGTFLGQIDQETAGKSMQLYLNRLDLEIEKLREGLAAKRKIGNCLGVMGGIFLVVVLL